MHHNQQKSIDAMVKKHVEDVSHRRSARASMNDKDLRVEKMQTDLKHLHEEKLERKRLVEEQRHAQAEDARIVEEVMLAQRRAAIEEKDKVGLQKARGEEYLRKAKALQSKASREHRLEEAQRRKAKVLAEKDAWRSQAAGAKKSHALVIDNTQAEKARALEARKARIIR
jgi:hypothetical protein